MWKRLCVAIGVLSTAMAAETVDTPQVHAEIFQTAPHQTVTAKDGHATNRVLIYLDSGSLRFKPAQGKPETWKVERGKVIWSPASGPYTIENTTNHPIRVLEVDLKGKPAGPMPASKLDPVVVDAAHYKVVLENDQVRVLRIHYPPHEKSPEHEHILNRVALFLNDQANGKTDEFHLSGAVKHVEKNDSDAPYDRIAVEIK